MYSSQSCCVLDNMKESKIGSLARVAHWNITYPSGNDYESREYRTTVYVYCQSFFGRDYIGEATINYKVTRDLNGEMVFNQKIPSTSKDRNMIRSTEDTELTVKFHDPSSKYFTYRHTYLFVLIQDGVK